MGRGEELRQRPKRLLVEDAHRYRPRELVASGRDQSIGALRRIAADELKHLLYRQCAVTPSHNIEQMHKHYRDLANHLHLQGIEEDPNDT